MRARKESKKKRQALDDDDGEHSRAKKSRQGDVETGHNPMSEASQMMPEGRPPRAGAGSGGRIAQLQRIGTAIESQHARKSRTTLADDTEANPLAPVQPTGRGKTKRSVGSSVSGQTTIAGRTQQVQLDPALVPRFCERPNNGRFGFHQPAAQDTNKPPAQHRSVSNSSGISDVTRRLPQLSCIGRQASPYASQRGNGMVDTHNESEEANEGSGVEGGKEDSEDDDEEGLEDGEHRIRPSSGFRSEVSHSQRIRHTSLPPDHEFTFSRDEDEGFSANLLRDEDDFIANAASGSRDHQENQTTDVLEHHQRKNGRPHAPDPAALATLRNQSATDHRGVTPASEPPVPGAVAGPALVGAVPVTIPAPASRRRRAPDQPPPANQIGHYSPMWRDCLEEAKMECRAVHALTNPWPKQTDLEKSITESLAAVVAQWTQRGVRFEPGYWPENKLDMAKLLYEDISTWRSEMKKAAITVIPLFYALTPSQEIQCPDPIMFAENAAIGLLNNSMFLRDGRDENGKTKNFAHPALKAALIKFFYTGSYRIAHQRPDVFRASIPNSCLALTASAFNCAFDGFSKNGAGSTFPKFSAKSYSSIYHGMLALVENVSEDAYHGPRLRDQLGRWAREGWAALQRVDQSVQRHDHLKVALD